MLQNSQKESSNSSIDIALSKCDPHVKDWISGLGLIEEEKYIKLFSENEIDMNEVPQLTALQLNEMGITAFGALNKILRGIKELKQKSKPEKKNSVESSSPKTLSSSYDHKNVLKSENDVRHSRVVDSDIRRSQKYDEHSNNSNEPRTNLRRSRSFVQPSSISKNAYSGKVSFVILSISSAPDTGEIISLPCNSDVVYIYIWFCFDTIFTLSVVLGESTSRSLDSNFNLSFDFLSNEYAFFEIEDGCTKLLERRKLVLGSFELFECSSYV
jgi:hypothetical protein